LLDEAKERGRRDLFGPVAMTGDVAMASTKFPTRADQITREWLTSALREHGSLGDGSVAKFTLATVPEPGQTADFCRILLEYEGQAGDAPRSLIGKFPASFGPAREVARMYNSYANEVRFYQELARERDLPVPEAYVAKLDEETGDFVLLLEDLSAARIGSLFNNSVADIATGLAQLARIHAEFWNDPALDRHSFIRKQDDPGWTDMLKGVVSQIIPAARAQFADQFSPQAFSAMDKWLELWDDIVKHTPDAMTLVHVDCHPKQMFFPTEELPRFALFDWQAPAKNPGANDVARLLVTGLDVEARRANERALVDAYYDALCAHGVQGLTKERLWLQIRLAHVWNFYINIVAALQTDVNILAAMAAAEGADWRVCLLGRVGAAIDDWKVGEALESYAAEARAARAG
jgi:hypothetical protein